MKVKLSLAAALLLVCTGALAQHDHGEKKSPPAMDPAMMEAMMKAGTPGEAHKALNDFAGSWKVASKFWMMPGAEPMAMEGSSESKWVMGGRYLEERFSGDFMGMPFEGLGFAGYDNVKKQYWSTWMDNMSTAMMSLTGSRNGNAWSYAGSMADPLTGKETPHNIKLTVTDADHHTMEMWGPGPDGQSFKMMEMTYTRKK